MKNTILAVKNTILACCLGLLLAGCGGNALVFPDKCMQFNAALAQAQTGHIVYGAYFICPAEVDVPDSPTEKF